MAFLVIGIILFIAGTVLSRTTDAVRRLGRPLMAGGIAVAILGAVTASFVQIDAGEIGIKTLFGRVQPDVLNSGLHFINPLLEVTKADAPHAELHHERRSRRRQNPRRRCPSACSPPTASKS